MKFINESKKITREYLDKFVKLNNEDVLAKELLKPVTELGKTKWSFEIDEQKRLINDVVQIKVNVKDVGVAFAYYSKEVFTKENKDELFEKLLTLKDIDVTASEENLNNKVTSLLKFLDEYKPYFAVVDFKSEAEAVITSLELSYQIILVNESYELVEDKEPVILDENGNPLPKERKKVTFKSFMKDFGSNLNENKVNYLLNVLYSLLVGTCIFLSVIYFGISNIGIGFLFVGFTFASFLLCSYNAFVFRKNKEGHYWLDYVLFSIFSLIGIVVGLFVGFIIAKMFIKPEEGQVLKYGLSFLFSGLLSPVLLAVTQGIGILINVIIHLIKNRKHKKEKTSK